MRYVVHALCSICLACGTHQQQPIRAEYSIPYKPGDTVQVACSGATYDLEPAPPADGIVLVFKHDDPLHVLSSFPVKLRIHCQNPERFLLSGHVFSAFDVVVQRIPARS